MDWSGQRTIIEPRRGRREDPVSPGILLSFMPRDLRWIRRSLCLEDVPGREIDFVRLWRCPDPRGGVSIVGPAIGAPAAAIALERLIAMGAASIVSVGSCGSLQPDTHIGEVILPVGAVVEEGTSAHYESPWTRMAPDDVLLETIQESLAMEGITSKRGRVWTTDAPFRETEEKVRRYGAEGILAVDMEVSALMSVASFRRVPFAAVLVVSDELGDLKWRRGFGDPAYRDQLTKVASVVADVLADRGGAPKDSHGKAR